MAAPLITAQLAAASKASSFKEGVAQMNSLVTDECQVKPRSIWRLGLRPPTHRFQDITSVLNTSTYTTLDRCYDCGLCVLGSGL